VISLIILLHRLYFPLFGFLLPLSQIRYYSKCFSILINNLFEILSKENIELIQKIENISQKSIRDKLLTYLSNEARKNKSNVFEISFNRQDLADYLNIDRSAMSFELSKMQKDGLVKFEKNKFMLKHA
jgi:CRP-like cAMP-binding protein